VKCFTKLINRTSTALKQGGKATITQNVDLNRVKGQNAVAQVFKKYPVTWFFVLAFAISWVMWLIGATALKGSLIGLAAPFAPAISAIIVGACVNPDPSHAPVNKRIAAFIVVFAITMAVTVQVALQNPVFDITFFTWFTLIAAINAYVFSSYYHPVKGVADIFSGLNQKGKRTVWLLIAFALPLGFQIGGAVLNYAMGLDLFGNVTVQSAMFLAAGLPYMFIFGGPSGEEPGWRGFATPHMQKYYNPLVVGLIIGILWTAWHLPLYFTGDYAGGVEAAILRFAWNVPLGVLFTWVYIKSDGNLLAALLLHTSNNLFVTLFTGQNQNMDWAVMIAFTVIVVVMTGFWRRAGELPTVTIPDGQGLERV
jgi:membrane protease YdiL (CAAX protease family)